MESNVGGSAWYLDSGVSFHMTRNKDFFSNLEERDLQLHIEIGDDGRYNTKGIVIVTFKRELGSHLHLKNVMFVPSPKKNLVSIVVLEDR